MAEMGILTFTVLYRQLEKTKLKSLVQNSRLVLSVMGLAVVNRRQLRLSSGLSLYQAFLKCTNYPKTLQGHFTLSDKCVTYVSVDHNSEATDTALRSRKQHMHVSK